MSESRILPPGDADAAVDLDGVHRGGPARDPAWLMGGGRGVPRPRRRPADGAGAARAPARGVRVAGGSFASAPLFLAAAAMLGLGGPASSGARPGPPGGAGGGGAPLYVEDFDRGGGLAGRWEGIGAIRAARVPVAGATIPGVAGRMVRVEAGPGSSLRTAPLAGGPPLGGCERIVFRVDAGSATPARPVVLEVQFLAAGRRARWWRKVELDRPGWREVDLPLDAFRTGGGSPDWEEVDRLGFLFRTGATLGLDGIELRRGGSPDAAYLSTSELVREAFGGGRPARVRVLRRGPFVVATDEPRLDGAGLLDALGALDARARADLPGLPAPRRPAPLLVFADGRDYRGFWPRFARRFGAEMAPPRSGGFTALGVASAPAAADPAAIRPVFVHEASHALMGRRLGLDNRGEWLLEGLATRAQLAFSGQDLGPIARAGLADAGGRATLEDLLDGEPIPEPRYWQAALVIDWMLADPGRRERFLAALGAMRRRGSTDLRPLARAHFGAPLAELEASWLAWARGRFPPTPGGTAASGRGRGRPGAVGDPAGDPDGDPRQLQGRPPEAGLGRVGAVGPPPEAGELLRRRRGIGVGVGASIRPIGRGRRAPRARRRPRPFSFSLLFPFVDHR